MVIGPVLFLDEHGQFIEGKKCFCLLVGMLAEKVSEA